MGTPESGTLLGTQRVGARVAWFVFTALALIAYLATIATARADFGATEAELENIAPHAAVLSCGATSGCVITDNAHNVPEADDKKVITAVDVVLPVGAYVVGVVVLDASDGLPVQYSVLAKSATTPSPADGLAFELNTQKLEDPLKVRAGQSVGLHVKGFAGSVKFRFHNTLSAGSPRLANASAWTGRGSEPGETYSGDPPAEVMNDPERPEPAGKCAFIPPR